VKVTWKPHWVTLGVTVANVELELDIDPRDASGEPHVTLRRMPEGAEVVGNVTADQLEELGAALVQAARQVRVGQWTQGGGP